MALTFQNLKGKHIKNRKILDEYYTLEHHSQGACQAGPRTACIPSQISSAESLTLELFFFLLPSTAS